MNKITLGGKKIWSCGERECVYQKIPLQIKDITPWNYTPWIFKSLWDSCMARLLNLNDSWFSMNVCFPNYMPLSLAGLSAKRGFRCVCVTEVCLFLRSFPVNSSVLFTRDEFIIHVTFRNMENCQLEAEEGRRGRCSSWIHLPAASGLASDGRATRGGLSPCE